MNLEYLQEIVKEGIVLTEHSGKYYADVVEENRDEHRLAVANSVDELHEQLRQFGQVN